MTSEFGFYKVSVCAPVNFSDRIMDAVDKAIAPMYEGYSRTFTITEVTGTWIPMPGSSPYDGKIGEITEARELRIDFAVRENELKNALEAILSVHPYEEPNIDILPMMGWKDVISP